MTAWAGRRARRLVALVLDTYGDTCHLCMQAGATSADHIVPRSAGGNDSLENLRPAHRRCNYQRGNRSIAWWRSRYMPELTAPRPTDGRSFFDSRPLDTPRFAPLSFPNKTKI